jgi:hypothetical protein
MHVALPHQFQRRFFLNQKVFSSLTTILSSTLIEFLEHELEAWSKNSIEY